MWQTQPAFLPNLQKETISGNVLMFLLNEWGFWKCLVVLHGPSRRTSRSHLCQPNTPTGQLRSKHLGRILPYSWLRILRIWWKAVMSELLKLEGTKGQYLHFHSPSVSTEHDPCAEPPTNPPGTAIGMKKIPWVCICFLIKKFCM